MPSVVVCPACDLAHRSAEAEGARLICVRCRAVLQKPLGARLDTAIALSLVALILLIFSVSYPLVAMHSNGSTRQATLLGAARSLYDQGYATLALLVFLTTVLSPLAQILSLLYVLIPLGKGRRSAGQKWVFRILTLARPWTFIEVFMLGILVAMVRLASFATVVPGVALWAYALLMLALLMLNQITSPEQFWRWIERAHP